MDLEFEKQVNILTDCEEEDDLNEAKLLNLNNDISTISFQSNMTMFSNNQHNMTTPINFNKNIETEEEKLRKLSQQSFSSLFEKNLENFNNNNNTNNNKNSCYNNTYHTFNPDFQSNSFEIYNNFYLNNNYLLNLNHKNYNNAYNNNNNKRFNNNNNFNNITNNNNINNTTNNINNNSNNTNNINNTHINFQQNYYPFNSFCINKKSNIDNTTMSNYYHNNTMLYSHQSIPFIKMMKKNNNSNINNNNSINIDFNTKTNENMIAMIKDQTRSKFIQKKIEEKSPQFFKLYEQIKNNLYEIITDPSGNYVIQKYVEYCDKKIITKMLKNLKNNLYDISINKYGTRALQAMLKYMTYTDEEINIILNFIKGNVYNLIKNINGNRVIQSVLDNIKNKKLLSEIYKELNEKFLEISKLKEGGCVFPKLLKNITENDLNIILKTVKENIENLINDEYGNFFIQRCIDLNKENFNLFLLNFINKNKFINLSCQKYSSNVIENCLNENCSIKNDVINLITQKNNVSLLINDRFGNYIVQKCLTVIENKEQFNIVIQQIKDNIKNLNKTNCGRKILENLMKNYGEYLNDNINKSFNNNKQNYKKNKNNNHKKNSNKNNNNNNNNKDNNKNNNNSKDNSKNNDNNNV